MKPALSVIMSVFNSEKYLDKAIESILLQTYSNYEFIITNDGSTDSSLEIILKYAQYDERIFVINNSCNIGLAASLNNMIKIAKGEYIVRMDADDISHIDRFEKEFAAIIKSNSDFVFSQTQLVDEDGRYMCVSWKPQSIDKILYLLPYRNFIPHPTVMVRAEILKKNPYDESYRRGQDTNLWNRLLKKNINWYYIKEPLLDYRCSNKTNTFSSSYVMAHLCISNNCKKRTFQYFSRMNRKEKMIIFVKLMVPFRILLLKGLMQDYLKKRNSYDK